MRSHQHDKRGDNRRDEGFGPGFGPGFGSGPMRTGRGPGGRRGPGGDAEGDGEEFPRGRGRGRGGFGPGGHGGPFGPGGPRGRGRGFGRPGGWQQGDLPGTEDVAEWFTGRLPGEWFTTVEVIADREEITVVGTLNEEPKQGAEAEGAISRFRSSTKAQRIEIAQEAQARYGRKVAWGARLGDVEELFTTLSVPVMTRLRQPERQILDTLVDAGVARSRSDALAWCVRLTGEHTQEWLDQLRDAMSKVDELRGEGPAL